MGPFSKLQLQVVLLAFNLKLIYLLPNSLQLTRLLRKYNYDARVDYWMDHARAILKTLLHKAAKISHNYIIDRTHLNKIERIRTLSPFMKYRKVRGSFLFFTPLYSFHKK